MSPEVPPKVCTVITEPDERPDPDPVFLALLGELEDANGFADDDENTLLFYFADALVDIRVRPEGSPILHVVAVLLDPLGTPHPGDFDDPAEWRQQVVMRTMSSPVGTDGEVTAWLERQSDPDGSLGVMYLGSGGPRRFAPAITFEVPIDAVEPGFIRHYLSEFATAWANRSIANPPQMTWISA